jgi:hypothetical protein
LRPGDESIKKISEWLRSNMPDVNTREHLSADEIFKLGELIARVRHFPPDAARFALGADAAAVEFRGFLAGLKT